jgi:hypothetical protein
MNEVSIIINGVRYDAVERPPLQKGESPCRECDICDLWEYDGFPCDEVIGYNRVFKKSVKSLKYESGND